MQNKKWVIFLSLCTYLCFLGGILLLKKPVCIDSTVVESLDTVYFGEASQIKTLTAYQCSQKTAVPFSEKLESLTQKVQNRIATETALLNSIEPFKKKIKLIIREDRPLMFDIKDEQLSIGSSLFQYPGHLERGIIKIWIRENLAFKQISTTLFEESLADLLYFVTYGNIEIQDPFNLTKTKLGTALWPQVLKNLETYCESAWKSSEHFENCGYLNSNIQVMPQEHLSTLSLRPLVTSALIQSYLDLPYQQKQDLIQNFGLFLSQREFSSEQAISMIMVESNPIQQGILNIKKVSDLFARSQINNNMAYRALYSGLTQNLQQSGVNDSFAEAYFDYLIEIPDQLNPKTSVFKNLEQAALKNLKIQVAIKDKEHIWILPSRTSLPLSAFDQIKSEQHVFFACSSLKEFKMDEFFNRTEKLMVVKGCDQFLDYNFSSLIREGAKGFIQQNAQMTFVQFHLPSLQMKQKELAHVQNYFELVKNRDLEKPEFRTLGWNQIQWHNDVHAYKPKANIDAIEYFRTN